LLAAANWQAELVGDPPSGSRPRLTTFIFAIFIGATVFALMC
jgi:hypothetical protein